MANKAKGFSMTKGRRESGAEYWIVRGTLNGKQHRKEFSDYGAAKAFQEQRHAEAGGFSARHHSVLTSLSPDELEQAEAFFAELRREWPDQTAADVLRYYATVVPVLPAGELGDFAPALKRLNALHPGTSLAEVCHFYSSNRGNQVSSVTLESAAEHYLADVLRRRNGGTLGKWQFDRIGQETQKLLRHLGQRDCRTISTLDLENYLDGTSRNREGLKGYQNKTWNNRRGVLCTFFSYCSQKGWLDRNPAVNLKVWRKAELAMAPVHYLSASRALELLRYVEQNHEGRLVPYFALTLFAGIRPSYADAEITRFEPSWVNLVKNVIQVPKEKSKVKKKREIKLAPNLRAWLEAYPLEKHPIVCRNFRNLLLAVREKFQLQHDELRHTFCTMLVGKTQSVADAAMQAGNSEAILWSHYLDLVGPEDAADFWNIYPSRS
ncbi:MAG: hypothetical protein C0518_01065 [Opitutus sp.]|nr:hypothetical protein [Opitutus sp.]